MTVNNVRQQDSGREERKGLEEIGGCLIDAIGNATEWWHWLLAAARRPAVAILKADQVRSRNQMNQTEEDAGHEELKFDRHSAA